MSRVKKIGGFFICCIFLIVCEPGYLTVSSFDSKSKTDSIEEKDVDSEDVREERYGGLEGREVEFWAFDLEGDGLLYINNDFGMGFRHPMDWHSLELNVSYGDGRTLIMCLGNFEFNDGFHPEAGEILVELIGIERERGFVLDECVARDIREFGFGRLVVEIDNGDSVEYVWKLEQAPVNWQGGWFPRYVDKYYVETEDYIFVFSAVVNLEDKGLLADFLGLVETLRFEGGA